MKRSNQSLWARTAVALFTSVVGMSACGSDEKDDGSGDESTAGAAGTGGAAAGPDAGGGAGGSGGAPPPPECEPDPTWQDCAVDADCKPIRLRTCVACFWLSVNVASEQDAIACYGDLTNCVDRVSAPCSLEPQGATCNNGRCDVAVDCSTTPLNLCGEEGKCSLLQGRPCQTGDGGSEMVRVGCFLRPPSVTTGRTCAEDPVTGQQLVFLSDEIPPGWTTCDVAACAP